MLYYLPSTFQPARILELGCGTGNLTRVLRDRYPTSEITVVDFSPEMLTLTQEKLGPDNLILMASSFETLHLEAEQYDLVISSIACITCRMQLKAFCSEASGLG